MHKILSVPSSDLSKPVSMGSILRGLTIATHMFLACAIITNLAANREENKKDPYTQSLLSGYLLTSATQLLTAGYNFLSNSTKVREYLNDGLKITSAAAVISGIAVYLASPFTYMGQIISNSGFFLDSLRTGSTNIFNAHRLKQCQHALDVLKETCASNPAHMDELNQIQDSLNGLAKQRNGIAVFSVISCILPIVGIIDHYANTSDDSRKKALIVQNVGYLLQSLVAIYKGIYAPEIRKGIAEVEAVLQQIKSESQERTIVFFVDQAANGGDYRLHIPLTDNSQSNWEQTLLDLNLGDFCPNSLTDKGL